MSEPTKPDLEHGADVAADFPSRLVETSAGWVLLEPHFVPGLRHEVVDINVLGSDGWSVYQGAWSGRAEEQTLGATLADACRIPLDEAERIADEVLEEWRSRGGAGHARRVKRTVSRLTLVAGLVVLLALVGLVLGVWEVVQLLA